MNIQYEWKIDFISILTMLGLIGSFLYTFYSNIINRNRSELKSLSEIYNHVMFLLQTPDRIRKEKYLYTHENKSIEKIVRRKIIEFDNELDTYWSYYNKKYPELNSVPEAEHANILFAVEKEFEKAMDERLSLKGLILSPAFYCDNKDVYDRMQMVKSYLVSNSFIFCKPIRKQIDKMISVNPLEVMEKYRTQLEHDPEYFDYNSVQFEDPYRYMLILLRRRYEWLSMSPLERILEVLRQAKYSKGRALFRRHKWITTGAIA